MSRLQNLIYFGVGENSFVGSFPTSLFTIPSLIYITLEGNHFKGPIEFGNTSLSSKLEFLVLDGNQFDGLVPESISQFLNLKELDLGFNSFTGPIPKSMSQLVNLYYLDFSYNKLEGKVPGCLWRLDVVKLSYNSLSSFETPDETKIKLIGLNSNSFQGPFPHWICKLKSLMLLDMSNNMFNGSIPQCFWNSTGSLVELVLSHNNFSGSLPDIFANAIHLNAIDVSSNQLEGKLPKSLIHCRGMKFLNLKRNKIKDKFPFWLGSLPLLHVLLLGSNQFYGSLYHRHGLQNLRVIDVSHNDFSGTFPSFYFSNWREMTSLNTEHEDGTYMKDWVADAAFYHSMDMMHKGVDREFEKVREDFRAIDFSRNRLYGNIPQSIGLLKELRILNLSGNAFTSNIPQTLANLTKLEQLDLSWNQLSGQIPRDLASLSFLSTMDFSHNNLEGPIPRSTQFQSQNCSSFKDNPKLYGLEEFCGETHLPSPTPKESKDFVESEEQVINWIAAAISFGPGLFCGLVIGHIFVSHNYYWFVEIFRRNRVCTIRAR